MKLNKQTTKILNLNWGFRLKLWDEGDKLWDEGDKLCAEGNKLCAEGNKLRAEGNKLCAEGDKLWAETILAVCGNVTMNWKSETECVVDGKHTFAALATKEDK